MANEWLQYIRTFDEMLEAALLICAKNSLVNIYDALKGDGGIGPAPIISMEVDIVDKKV